MPTYDYRCGVCDEVFELRRPMAESSDPATCPGGHDGARRMLSVFAAVGSSTGSDPAPMSSGPPMGCGGACACHPG
ncbi:MAG: FmdB family transcriptional regulator [Acidimicrobiaceae bacterium]|nr:FmdB family transcriptional regulator [Acidimicrobiaceae bacterium]